MLLLLEINWNQNKSINSDISILFESLILNVIL